MFRRWLISPAAMILVTLAVAESPEPRPATHRLLAAVEHAWRQGPARDYATASQNLSLAETRAESLAGNPVVELQTEGLSNQPNAAHYLRLGVPFHFPWLADERRGLLSAAESSADSAMVSTRLESSKQTILAWIDLARAQEERAVHAHQLTLLETALRIETLRQKLGEAAGAEVTQLRLERFRLQAELATADGQVHRASSALARIAGPDSPRPRLGDLKQLVEGLEPLPTSERLALKREGAPALERGRALREQVVASGLFSRKTAWGSPELALEWEHIPSIDGGPSFDAIGLLIQLPLPIGKTGQIAAAKATAAERLARTELTLIERSLRSVVEAGVAQIETLASLLPEIERIESSLGSITTGLRTRQKLGGVTYLEFLDELSRLDEVRIRAIATRFELLARRAELATTLNDATIFPLPTYPDLHREAHP